MRGEGKNRISRSPKRFKAPDLSMETQKIFMPRDDIRASEASLCSIRVNLFMGLFPHRLAELTAKPLTPHPSERS